MRMDTSMTIRIRRREGKGIEEKLSTGPELPDQHSFLVSSQMSSQVIHVYKIYIQNG